MLRVGRGDRDACHMLVERHLGRIHAFATRVLGNAAEGEDIAQEVFLRLWKHASRWQPTGAKLTTWLHRIALNLCLNKKERRRETPSEHVPETRDPGPEPAEAARRREMERLVNGALADLPTNQRAAITLCHYQGMRNAEAAEILGVSVEALESLLARGRRGMRARLADVAGELLEGGSV
jgi:RNA polymerase sigma-70 factor (ECF subfamily)